MCSPIRNRKSRNRRFKLSSRRQRQLQRQRLRRFQCSSRLRRRSLSLARSIGSRFSRRLSNSVDFVAVVMAADFVADLVALAAVMAAVAAMGSKALGAMRSQRLKRRPMSMVIGWAA
jgi:hypothetical protein